MRSWKRCKKVVTAKLSTHSFTCNCLILKRKLMFISGSFTAGRPSSTRDLKLKLTPLRKTSESRWSREKLSGSSINRKRNKGLWCVHLKSSKGNIISLGHFPIWNQVLEIQSIATISFRKNHQLIRTVRKVINTTITSILPVLCALAGPDVRMSGTSRLA